MALAWSAWRRATSLESFTELNVGRTLELGGSRINIRSLEPAVLDSVLWPTTAVPSKPQAQMSLGVVQVVVASWERLSARFPGIRWESDNALERRDDFLALAEPMGQALSFHNLSTQITVWAIRDPEDPRWRRPEFVRPLVSRAAEQVGAIPAHGATLGNGNAGVLLTARGGSGKSSLTMAGIHRGLRSAGDDFLALVQSHEALHAYPLFRVGKLAASSPAWNLVRPVPDSGGELAKHLVELEGISGETPMVPQKLTAAVIPWQGASVGLTRASNKDLLDALLPSSAVLSSSPGSLSCALAAMVNPLPVFRLELTSALEEALDIVEELLAR